MLLENLISLELKNNIFAHQNSKHFTYKFSTFLILTILLILCDIDYIEKYWRIPTFVVKKVKIFKMF